MSEVRQVADELETIVDAELWPLPTYAEMLFLK
jgi:glutamine synthetase